MSQRDETSSSPAGKKGSKHPYNSVLDDTPCWPVHWTRGTVASQIALEEGLITEDQLEEPTEEGKKNLERLYGPDAVKQRTGRG